MTGQQELPKPRLIAHADWSTSASKRIVCTARPARGGGRECALPAPAPPLNRYFAQLRAEAGEGSILAGFDFPIGVPRRYAALAGIAGFPEALLEFGAGDWLHFYLPAQAPGEISILRPFYPGRPGGTTMQHLISGLGLDSAADLLRTCDRRTPLRNQACAIFWTLGANQVGRAAIAGWQCLLAPVVRTGIIKLWPFQGDLPGLLASGSIVAAETYPAETYWHIGLRRGFGKRSREGRRAQAAVILEWCEHRGIGFAPDLRRQVEAGFGDSARGEDEFDALIGLLGMIEVVQGEAPAAIPDDPAVRRVEGWILGMNPAEESMPATVARRRSASFKRTVSTAEPARIQPFQPAGGGVPCPACGRKEFKRWPWGWDAHAAHKCTGIAGSTPEERKRVYRERYLP